MLLPSRNQLLQCTMIFEPELLPVRARLISEFSINGLEAVKETLEHLHTKTGV